MSVCEFECVFVCEFVCERFVFRNGRVEEGQNDQESEKIERKRESEKERDVIF